jgi:hypothetical protein
MAGPFDALTGYELRHLPRHLAQAGRAEELHRLLGLEHAEPDGRIDGARVVLASGSVNAWYAAVTRHADLRGYVDHLEVAAGVAEQVTRVALHAARPGGELAREFHYALCAASVRNVSSNVSVQLLTTLVRRGLLTPDDALSYVRQVPDPRDRAEGLSTLLGLLDGETATDVAGEALAAVSIVEDEFWRVGELGRLAPHLPAWLSAQAAVVADNVGDTYYRAVALAIVRDAIDPQMQRTVADLHFHRKNIMATEYDLTEVASSFRAEFTQRRTHAVAILGEVLGDRPPETISSAYWLAETYAVLAEQSEAYLRDAIAGAGRVGGQEAHVALVRAIAARLATIGWASQAAALLAEEIPDPVQRLVIMCELASTIGIEPPVGEVATLADPWARLRALRAVLPVVSDRERDRLVGAVLTAQGDAHVLAEGLTIVAPYLDDQGWATACRAANGLADDEQRARVRGILIRRGLALGRDDALALLDQIDDEYWHAEALQGAVEELLRRGQAPDALVLAGRAPYPHRRVGLLASCAAAMDGAARGDALAWARRTVAELAAPSARACALTLLADALTDSDRLKALHEAADAATAIEKGNEPLRSGAIAAVVDSLADTGQVDQALDLAKEITDEHWLATALANASRQATRDHLTRILAEARSVRARRERGRALAAVASRRAELSSDPVGLHDAWREVLQTLALGERDEFLLDAVDLLPVAEALGGPESLVEMALTTRTVMRWWP